MTVAFVQDPPEGGLQDQSAQGRRGRRRNRGGGGEDDGVLLLTPPPEVWRSVLRHTLTDEERESGLVDLIGLPAGEVVRLDLRVGRQRLEGVARFTILPDRRMEVRVFPVSLEVGSNLEYIVSPGPLGPTAGAVGIDWRE